jgi:hypothetical protein
VQFSGTQLTDNYSAHGFHELLRVFRILGEGVSPLPCSFRIADVLALESSMTARSRLFSAPGDCFQCPRAATDPPFLIGPEKLIINVDGHIRGSQGLECLFKPTTNRLYDFSDLLPLVISTTPTMLLMVLVPLRTFLQAGVSVATISYKRDGGPVVSLSYAMFKGASSGGVESFLGNSYAKPPVGNLRSCRPQPPLPSSDTKLMSDPVFYLRRFYGDL